MGWNTIAIVVIGEYCTDLSTFPAVYLAVEEADQW